MKLFLPKLTFILLLFFSASFLFAQDMEVTDATTAPFTPENLITNVFLGEGIEVTSFQYDGDPAAVGYFDQATDELGMERGVIMTSGSAANVALTGNEFTSVGSAPNIQNDADLSILDPNNANNDISRYIISFIPTSDTISFNYSFGSEEYPEFACSSFNDVFGFFISGPGINGPFSNNAENIAIIPGTTDTYVSINNIHPQNGGGCPPVNDEFYNANATNQPIYDGFTDVFTATAVVIPCEEYTIKLAIADKGDNILDSGVFLEAKSFGSPPLDIDIATVSLDGGIVEGCTDAVINISLPDPVEADFPIEYEILGDAINGVDYAEIPLDLFIPQGDSTISVTITGFEDGIDEGIENFAIAVRIDPCNLDTFYIPIRENQLIDPDLGPDISQCASESVTLDASLDIDLPPVPTFTNETNFLIDPFNVAVISTIDVAGVQPVTLGPGVIRSVCVNIQHNWVDDIDIFLQAPNGQFISLSTDNGGNGNNYTDACFTPNATTEISFPGPFAPNTAPPFTGDWLPEGVWEDLYGGDTNGEWQLIVIDDSNGFTGELLDWSISFEPSYQLYYEWTPSEGLSCDDCAMPDASPDETTTYTVRVYDTYGCEVFDSITIEVIPALEAPNVVCSGITLECLTFSWDDIGSPTYEVSVDGGPWMPASGGLSHEVCGLGAEQTVVIEVRGSDPQCDGFIGTGECTTPECEVPTVVTQNEVDVSCNGGNDGELTIEMTGNFPPFTYTIDGQTIPDVTTANFTGLTADLHDLTVVDASGCELVLQILIEEPAGAQLEDVLLQDVQCNGTPDGSATVIVTDFLGPLSFAWSNGEVDSVAVNLPGGNNEVSITDGNGCEIVSSIFITEPDPMEVTIGTDDAFLVCFDSNDGVLTSTVSGGLEPYTYAWSDPQMQDTPTAENLSVGDYTLVVTDANNCSVPATASVTSNTEITTSVTATPAACDGSILGTATVTAEGGDAPLGYTYVWSTDDNQDTQTATGLNATWYYVTVSNLFACEVVDSIQITAPDALEIEFTQTPTSCSDSADGGASLTVTGGTGPYTYEWSDGGAQDPDRDDLAAGMQTVTVSDSENCATELMLDIESASEILVEITENIGTDCFGGNTGSLTVTASGGDENFTFAWNDPAAQTDATASNLTADNYCVTVTDGEGCSATICEDVSEPEALSVSETIENTSCFAGSDGTVTVTPAGGTEPYDYLWSNGQMSATATDLPAGDATVDITDANGCTISATYTVTEPTELTATTEFTALSCDGSPDGTATAFGSGGTEPYTFVWSDGQPGQTAVNLDATTYQVTVVDANLCEATAEVTLTEPVQVVIEDVTFENVSCFGGTDGAATLIFSGGTEPFDIEWSNGATGENIDGVPADNYTVTVSDLNGCTATTTITIEQPADLNITLNQTGSFCFNGDDGTASVTSLAYGNTPADIADFTFIWNTNPAQTAATAVGLNGGQEYEVEITDQAGCQWTESITVGNPAEIGVVTEEVRNVTCFEAADGAATVAGGGGTTPYSYQWSVEAGAQTTATAGDLAAGSYRVTVTDANGCATQTEVTVTEPTALDLTFDTQATSCAGDSDGTARATPAGGTSPYTVAWSSGDSGLALENLAAGLYTVSVVDANSCSYNDTVRVFEPAGVDTEAVGIEVTCFGYEDGAIDLVSTGGTAPYTYSLDGENFFGSSRLIGLTPDFYDVTIRDGNGCEFQVFDVEVGEPDELTVELGEDIRIDYGDTPQLVPDVAGSAGGDIYEWNPIGDFVELNCYDCTTAIVDTFSGQLALEVTVTDQNGCTATDMLTIFVDKKVLVQVPTGFSPNGNGNNEFLQAHGDSDIEVEVFRIYDRWGELLYEAGGFNLNDPLGWDGTFRGKDMPPGIYVWYMEIRAEDGEPATFKGNTTLIR